MDPIAKLGLLKMDFLGLINLTILGKALDIIAKSGGARMSLNDIPLDDQKTFDILSSGETTGIFQLESSGMRRYIKQLKPSSVNDVAAMIALYRPGPMEHITRFIEAKHQRAEVTYPHPALSDILEETYGVIVYQDQVLPDPSYVCRLQPRPGRRGAEGDGKEDSLPHGKGAGTVPGRGQGQGVPPGFIRIHVRTDTALRRLRIQQGPQRQLRHDLLLDCLSEGQLSRGVHDRPTHLPPRPVRSHLLGS